MCAPTGNGRRESFAHLPMPRMTNTYMLAGDKDPDEIVRVGQQRAIRDQFRRRPGRHHQRQVRVLRMAEAYMIEDGKVTHPVKGATLIGNGPDALTR